MHLGAFSFFLGAKCWNLAALSFAPRILFLFLGATEKILGAFSFFCFRVQSQHRVYSPAAGADAGPGAVSGGGARRLPYHSSCGWEVSSRLQVLQVLLVQAIPDARHAEANRAEKKDANPILG